MKNFHILRVHGKTRALEGWVHEKPMYRGGCLKRGAWTGAGQFADLRGGLGKKVGGGVFEMGLIPQCTLWASFLNCI